MRGEAGAEAKLAGKQELYAMIRKASKMDSGRVNTYYVTRQMVHKQALEMIGKGHVPPKQLLKSNAMEKIFEAFDAARNTESGIVRVKRDWLNLKAPSDSTIQRARRRT